MLTPRFRQVIRIVVHTAQRKSPQSRRQIMLPVIIRNPQRPLEFNPKFGFSVYPRKSEDKLIISKFDSLFFLFRFLVPFCHFQNFPFSVCRVS